MLVHPKKKMIDDILAALLQDKAHLASSNYGGELFAKVCCDLMGYFRDFIMAVAQDHKELEDRIQEFEFKQLHALERLSELDKKTKLNIVTGPAGIQQQFLKSKK